MYRFIQFKGKTVRYDPKHMPLWAEGNYYTSLEHGVIKHLITDGAHTFEVYEKTVSEYSGLFDDEQIPIYEGDLLALKNQDASLLEDNPTDFCFVGWNNLIKQFSVLRYWKQDNTLSCVGALWNICTSGAIKVIGHISDYKEFDEIISNYLNKNQNLVSCTMMPVRFADEVYKNKM